MLFIVIVKLPRTQPHKLNNLILLVIYYSLLQLLIFLVFGLFHYIPIYQIVVDFLHFLPVPHQLSRHQFIWQLVFVLFVGQKLGVKQVLFLWEPCRKTAFVGDVLQAGQKPFQKLGAFLCVFGRLKLHSRVHAFAHDIIARSLSQVSLQVDLLTCGIKFLLSICWKKCEFHGLRAFDCSPKILAFLPLDADDVLGVEIQSFLFRRVHVFQVLLNRHQAHTVTSDKIIVSLICFVGLFEAG